MDAFEQIVDGLFRQMGYWTQTGYKINITSEDKRAIGKPSMPRPEIDILAYKPADNELLWIECKSYLDSYGVWYGSFLPNGKGAESYKIFTDANYRKIASERLLVQAVQSDMVLPNANLRFCLVAGKVRKQGREDLHSYFESQNWTFYDELWLKQQLNDLAQIGYENNIAVMVAKLFAKG
jgi:hypothetical protein